MRCMAVVHGLPPCFHSSRSKPRLKTNKAAASNPHSYSHHLQVFAEGLSLRVTLAGEVEIQGHQHCCRSQSYFTLLYRPPYCFYNNKAGAFTHNPATMAYRSPTASHFVSCVGLKVVFSKELDDGFGSYDHQYSAFERFNDAFTADWAVSMGWGGTIFVHMGEGGGHCVNASLITATTHCPSR